MNYLQKILKKKVLFVMQPDDMREIQQFCSTYAEIAAAYVFGSSATGKDRPGRDVDLVIMVNPKIEAMVRVEMETALSN
jgi:predicted nucleotidyltransferase